MERGFYADLLPSKHAIAAACWRLGLSPDYRNWERILAEAKAIEGETLLLIPQERAAENGAREALRAK